MRAQGPYHLHIMVAHPDDAGDRGRPETAVGAFFEAVNAWNEQNSSGGVFLEAKEWKRYVD